MHENRNCRALAVTCVTASVPFHGLALSFRITCARLQRRAREQFVTLFVGNLQAAKLDWTMIGLLFQVRWPPPLFETFLAVTVTFAPLFNLSYSQLRLAAAAAHIKAWLDMEP